MGVERGLKIASGHGFLAVVTDCVLKRASDFSERKLLAGEFSRPRDAPRPRGISRKAASKVSASIAAVRGP